MAALASVTPFARAVEAVRVADFLPAFPAAPLLLKPGDALRQLL